MLDKIKSYIPLNWAMVGNPVNWGIIMLMLLLAGVALAAILNPIDIFGDDERVV